MHALHGERPAAASRRAERFDVVVIGAGQAGLSVGYHLAKRGLRFVILDANERIGDSVAPAVGLAAPVHAGALRRPGRHAVSGAQPAPSRPRTRWPTTSRRTRHGLRCPCALASAVERCAKRKGPLRRQGRASCEFEADAGRRGDGELPAAAVPGVRRRARPGHRAAAFGRLPQPHAAEARRACSSRARATRAPRSRSSSPQRHRCGWRARDTGHSAVPHRQLPRAQLAVHARAAGGVPSHPHGRARRSGARCAPACIAQWRAADPRQAKPVCRPRRRARRAVAGVSDGKPLLDDGRVLEVANVVWCTGFHPGFSWIDLPVFGEDGEPRHERGVVTGEPGLYFVGLHFLYAMSSTMIHGVGARCRARRGHDRGTASRHPKGARLAAAHPVGIGCGRQRSVVHRRHGQRDRGRAPGS